MECRETQKLLSAYFDDELSAEVRSSVMEHVQGCSRCDEELAAFGQLSMMAKGLDDPEPPQDMWTSIEAGLKVDKERATVGRPKEARGGAMRTWHKSLITTAALMLVATGVVWIAGKMWHDHGHHGEMAVDFEEYLEHFADSPETAQNVLLAKYDGGPVNMTEATKQLGYRPAVAAGLPSRYLIEETYVLDMPCCKCVQTICRRDDGQVFAIFEHDEEQPVWFGDRPITKTVSKGCPCSIIQANGVLVASWKADKRQLTVVGVGDLEEVEDLIGHFQGDGPDV